MRVKNISAVKKMCMSLFWFWCFGTLKLHKIEDVFLTPLKTADRPSGVGCLLFWFWVGNFVGLDRKSTRLNSSHVRISYAVFCLKKKKKKKKNKKNINKHK